MKGERRGTKIDSSCNVCLSCMYFMPGCPGVCLPFPGRALPPILIGKVVNIHNFAIHTSEIQFQSKYLRIFLFWRAAFAVRFAAL